MDGKTKIILDIDQQQQSLFSKQYINVVDIKAQIEEMQKQKPKKMTKKWKNDMNFLINLYNIKVGWQQYKKV